MREPATNRLGSRCICLTCTPPTAAAAPILSGSFILRAAIALGIGAAGASGLGSILGFILGAL